MIPEKIQIPEKMKKNKQVNKQAQVLFCFILFCSTMTHQHSWILISPEKKFFAWFDSIWSSRYKPIHHWTRIDTYIYRHTHTTGANDGNQSKWQLSNLSKWSKMSTQNDRTMNYFHSNNYLIVIYFYWSNSFFKNHLIQFGCVKGQYMNFSFVFVY